MVMYDASQVKYSEMTIDMFRMIQTLERETRRQEEHAQISPPSRQSFVSTKLRYKITEYAWTR